MVFYQFDYTCMSVVVFILFVYII